MTWKKGESGNPGGKPEGAKNRFTHKFWVDLAYAWEQKGVDAMERVIASDPATFLRVAANLLPKEDKVEHTHTIVETWRDRLSRSRTNQDLGSEDSTTEANASPSVSAIDAAAKPTLQ